MAIPSVDLSLSWPEAVALVSAAARSCGFFYVTNHGIPVGTIDAAFSAARAFHELSLPERAAFYSIAPTRAVAYSNHPHPPNHVPPLPWRDTLSVRFGPDLICCLPAACRDALQEYQRSLVGFGKAMAGLLSEALGVGAERLEQAVQLEASAGDGVPLPPAVPGPGAGRRRIQAHRHQHVHSAGAGRRRRAAGAAARRPQPWWRWRVAQRGARGRRTSGQHWQVAPGGFQ